MWKEFIVKLWTESVWLMVGYNGNWERGMVVVSTLMNGQTSFYT
jgi:hypothetical protein